MSAAVMKNRFTGPQHRAQQRVGRSKPPPMGELALAEMDWGPDTPPEGAAVEERLKDVAKSMPFAISLLGPSKDDLIAVVEAMVEQGGCSP
jgi:hypothetical protein